MQAEQQVLPGVGADRATLTSPSALDRYQRCPRLYKFLYVDRLREARTTPAQSLGLAIHAVLRDFFRLPVARRDLGWLLAAFRAARARQGYGKRDEGDPDR